MTGERTMPGLIDFHHHARPAAFFEALADSGRTTMGGRPFPPAWTIANALTLMDRTQIATAVVSAPDADLLYRDRTVALRLSSAERIVRRNDPSPTSAVWRLCLAADAARRRCSCRSRV